MRWHTRTAVIGGLVLVGLGLGGCSAIGDVLSGGETVTRDTESQEVTEGGTADVFTLRVGDCFDDTTDNATEVSEVAAVPCADPHDNEVYHEFTLSGDEWPGQDAIDAEAEAQCTPAFDEFVGIAYAESMYEWFPLTPTEAGWDQLGDRVVQCVIYHPSLAKIEGSLAGIAG